jgi:flagellar basal-body rod protein FlgB
MANTSRLLEGAMRWWSARGGLTASNVARADIPGEKSRDFAQTLAEHVNKPVPPRLPMASTTPGHRAGRLGEADRVAKVVEERGPSVISGNEISVEEEMMKLAEISAQHQLAATTYRKNVSLLRLALRGGR